MAPDQAQYFCYMVDDVLVADVRLTFGWAGSPGHWGVMSVAAALSHRNTTVETADILSEGKAMMSHMKITEPWEIGRPRQVPPCVRVENKEGANPMNPSLPLCMSMTSSWHAYRPTPRINRHSIIASASLASDHIRLFGPGEAGATPILAPKKRTDWDTIVDLLGFTVNTHTLRKSVTEGKIAAIRLTLEQEWPLNPKQASAQEVLGVAGKL